MKYIAEFRCGERAKKLAAVIRGEADPDRDYRLMEFCGGHTHAIFRFGLQELMPENVSFVHGPGCPVCVLPTGRIDAAIDLVRKHDVILCIYGDLMRVPGSGRMSLLKARAEGGDIRMVYSTRDALAIAREHRSRRIVFFAIGFETTTPPTAVAIRQAWAEGLKNFTVYCNHVLTPPALRFILQENSGGIDGVLGPSHVSTIIGSGAYEPSAEVFSMPLVIAGFEPLDVMQSSLMLIRQINAGRHEVENEYTRAVTHKGNGKAKALMADVFETRPTFEWRGLGMLEDSALAISGAYAEYDAERRFAMTQTAGTEAKACLCPSILRGVDRPTDCKLFGTVCTPENPIGACMVSSEGACAAYWSYGRFRQPAAA